MPITVDPAFIKNTKQPGRSLQIVVAMEDLDAVSDSLDSKEDWDGSTSLLNVDTNSETGSVIGQVMIAAIPEGFQDTKFTTTAISRIKARLEMFMSSSFQIPIRSPISEQVKFSLIAMNTDSAQFQLN